MNQAASAAIICPVRGLAAFALLLLGGTAAAEDDPRRSGIRPFEASGFLGLGVFGDDIELGNSWAPEQVPNTAPVVGARLGWLAIPRIIGSRDGIHLAGVIEGEASLATAFTGGSSFEGDQGRMSYFAPVIGWRAHAMVRLAGLGSVAPHLLVGAGGETVASSSPYMSKDTDAIFYWGPGVSIAVTERWQVRVDLRHGVMAARDAGMTSTLEAQLGLSARFGGSSPPHEHEQVIVKNDPDPPIKPIEPDPPVVTPPPDPDGDGLVGDADKCPDIAEDVDKFADDDGCPDPDNDGDGIDDVKDVCPLMPETRNGVDDADGCPDTVPDNITKALATGAKLRFEGNRARVTAAAQTALRPLYLMMLAHPDVMIRITGHPDKAGGDDLAKRRADAVKWWLVDQGVTEGRIAISLSETVGPVIELTLRAE